MGRVGRGIYKKRKTWFQPNHKLTPRRPEPHSPTTSSTTTSSTTTRYTRPTRQQLHLATPKDERGEFCLSATQIAREDCRNVMLLRPKTEERTPVEEIQLRTVEPKATTSGQPQPVSESDQHGGIYRIVELDLTMELASQSVLEHRQTHPHCDGQLRFQAQAEERRGLAVSEALACNKCDYATQSKKLYKEVPRDGNRPGRRTAVPNMSPAGWPSQLRNFVRRSKETVGVNGHRGSIQIWSAKGSQQMCRHHHV